MSGKVQIFNCGEQGAKLEAFEKSIENGSVGNISEDEKRRQKELEISGRIAQETFNDFKDGEFSGYQTLVKDPTLIKNEKARVILSSPFMSTVAQGLITAGYLGLYLPNRDMVPNDSMFAAAVSLSLPLAIHSGANTINSLCKTNMAKCFGYALKNSVKDTKNTVKNIKRAKNIADAKKRSEKINESKDRQQAVLSNSSEPQTTNKEKNTLIVERPFDKFMEGYRANLKQNKFRGGK